MTNSSDVDIISSLEAWAMLENEPGTQLVDVRTMVEWAYVGVPDLAQLGKEVVTVEWTKMSGQQNSGFVRQLQQAVPDLNTKLLFICRAGIRSHAAAVAARHAGYTDVLNVNDGFDGPLDDKGQRKTVSGWCAENLPWNQS